MNILKLMACLVVALFLPLSAWAGWIGPEEVISGSWGSGEAQFGFIERYSKAEFPKQFLVDEDGNIIIADPVNKRIKVYTRSGKLKSIIKPKLIYDDVKEWPPETIAVSNARFLVFSDGILQQYDYSGNLKKEVRIPNGQFIAFLPNGQFVLNIIEKKETESSGRDKGFGLFSPDGELLRTSLLMPLELGRSEDVDDEKSGVNEAYTHVTFPGRTYTLIQKMAYKFVRDKKDEEVLIITDPTPIKRFRCGILLAQLELPKSEYETIRPGDAQSSSVSDVVVEYGQPVAASNGDIYLRKRTHSSYSILKWTWADSEERIVDSWQNEPRNLTAETTPNGIMLFWDTSHQDPACVTGYEVGRATKSGGPYAKIGTVSTGSIRHLDSTAEQGKTYYYAVRAVLGKILSGYSNEVESTR